MSLFIKKLLNNSSNKLLGKFVDFRRFELPLAIIFLNFFKNFFQLKID